MTNKQKLTFARRVLSVLEDLSPAEQSDIVTILDVYGSCSEPLRRALGILEKLGAADRTAIVEAVKSLVGDTSSSQESMGLTSSGGAVYPMVR
jgi:hypothetical protein